MRSATGRDGLRVPARSIRAKAGVTCPACAIALGSILGMSVIQHIVAENGSPKCNELALSLIFPLRHTGAMADNDSNDGPNYLRAWRKFRGLSQVELAELVGSTHQVVGYLERGRTQLSAKWLRKLAEALETTPGHLLDVDPEKLGNDIVDIWSRIPDRDREQAARVLRSFTRTGTDD